MGEAKHDAAAKSATLLAQFIERIERIDQERAAGAEDRKAVLSEAASIGFNKKELNRIITTRRKDAKKVKVSETVFDTYVAALATLAGTPLGDWASGFLNEDVAAAMVIDVRTPEEREAERIKVSTERARVARESLDREIARRDAERIASIPDAKKSAVERAMETSKKRAAAAGAVTKLGERVDLTS